ncbi:zinc finger CCCH domain-containing protein 2 [Cajanus cajan]|uniref:Zinc finger CCCH domain-containing protein 2 n=1 Tax=Cajanus cajan TaxID=3821 RepID=A0A151SEY4_CAJCA|nr:zinc finger CCCH domain-containing protein 2 [Cajanus cajan]KYP53366.1 Zinc finger CCCH domain-containing protein 2 [Cajanus cajan]
MSSVCAEQHKFHPSHQLLSPKKSLREIDIPPRKLLTRRAAAACSAADVYSDETMLQKFLPSNTLDDSDEDDPYSSDHFRMFEFKVRRCTRSRSHDWTDCPFAHPGEKARRRDPRRYHYSGTVCPEYRRGGCSRGDACEYAHGVFECWLHPARYRTEACKDGKNCKRKVCFFAHTPRQLRILPVNSSNDMTCKKNVNKLLNHGSRPSNNCCLFCHGGGGGGGGGSSSTASPTSTLFSVSHFSPPLSPSSSTSPPQSPLKPLSGVSLSPISRYGAVNVNHHHGVVSYKDMFAELVNSLEGLSFNEGSPVSGAKAPNLPWLDVSFNYEEQQQQKQQQQQPPFIVSSFGCDDQQFIFSPPAKGKLCCNKIMGNENKVVGGDVNGPDLAWVNELLM